ncbi:MAG: trehalose 6-phosphate synthase [Gaiellaceae bacterium]|jgi:trehalose 6-phosphate synthase|nr:trehalose 6-phosphate synthase [Gaiellaceae bacterium]
MRRKLIVVSNRGPVSYGRGADGTRTARRGGGGLVTALSGLVKYHDVTWIASAITEEDRAVAGETREETARDGSPYKLRLVAHDRQAYDWYYNVVANPMLWFVQHSLWELPYAPQVDAAFHRAWAEGYVTVNASFAGTVEAELERTPGAAVFFHDYHLYLAPRMVRERRPDAALMHFVHVPWPQPDYWRIFPRDARCAIHDGLMANDVIGFQTDRWRRNFIYSVRELLGEDATPKTVTAPISVDSSEFVELAQSAAVLRAEAEILADRPEHLVVRVDRTDPSKNIVRGFRAFELYLDAHPEMHRRVGMLALLNPSRQDIPEYAEYLGAIQREARRVNDRFQQSGWRPIDLEIADDFAKSIAAYKQFDVLMVNAIFDGMNLVAKEAPLVNTRDGVVVLSENAGAHAELGEWALTVNPFDVEGQAVAIDLALSMDAGERHARLEAIRAHVREHDLNRWTDSLLAALDRVASPVHR